MVEHVRQTAERARALELARARSRRSRRTARRIDDLNVYPVPDGDTGTNLDADRARRVEALEAEGPDDRAGSRTRSRARR